MAGEGGTQGLAAAAPQPHRAVRSPTDDGLVIPAQRHRPDPSLMAREGGTQGLAAAAPQPHRAVISPTDDGLAIPAQRHRPDHSLMAREGGTQSLAAAAPQPHRAVISPTNDGLAIPAQRHRPDHSLMAPQQVALPHRLHPRQQGIMHRWQHLRKPLLTTCPQGIHGQHQAIHLTQSGEEIEGTGCFFSHFSYSGLSLRFLPQPLRPIPFQLGNGRLPLRLPLLGRC